MSGRDERRDRSRIPTSSEIEKIVPDQHKGSRLKRLFSPRSWKVRPGIGEAREVAPPRQAIDQAARSTPPVGQSSEAAPVTQPPVAEAPKAPIQEPPRSPQAIRAVRIKPGTSPKARAITERVFERAE